MIQKEQDGGNNLLSVNSGVRPHESGTLSRSGCLTHTYENSLILMALIGLLLLLVVVAGLLIVYSDMRKIHSGQSSGETCARPEVRNGDHPAEPSAPPEPPPAAAVLESSETMDTKPESEAPADGDGR